MVNEKKQKRAKKRCSLPEAVVCYIDYLGFRDNISSLEKAHDRRSLMIGYKEIADKTVNEFVPQVAGLLQESLPKDENEQIDYREIQIRQISDAFIIWCPIHGQVISPIIFSMLLIARTVQHRFFQGGSSHFGRLIAEEKIPAPFLRGCLTIGEHFVDGDYILSPACIEAMEMEKNIFAPVIAVTKKIERAIEDEDHEIKKTIQSMLLRESMKVSFQCGEYGVPAFIDYFHSVKEPDLKKSLEKHRGALFHNRDIAIKRQSSRGVFEKLRWLIQYHNHVAQRSGHGGHLVIQDSFQETQFVSAYER